MSKNQETSTKNVQGEAKKAHAVKVDGEEGMKRLEALVTAAVKELPEFDGNRRKGS